MYLSYISMFQDLIPLSKMMPIKKIFFWMAVRKNFEKREKKIPWFQVSMLQLDMRQEPFISVVYSTINSQTDIQYVTWFPSSQ